MRKQSYDKSFSKDIDVTRQRIGSLLGAPDLAANPETQQIIEELNVVLEELRVADEELRVQCDELTKAKRQAEHDRLRYQELFDHAPDGYLVTDLSGVIQEANIAFLEMVDTPAALVLRKKMHDFVADRSKQAFTDRLTGITKNIDNDEWHVKLQSLTRSPFLASIRMNLIWNSRKELMGIRWMIREVMAKEAANRN